MYKIEYNKLHASFLDSLLFVPIVHFATVRFASIPSINQYNKFQHHKDNHKNQEDTKTPSISTSSPLFLRLPLPTKNKNPQQNQSPLPPITGTPAPIMIGRCKDNTNKNRKLAVSAGHRPDGEETKKDTQRSRGSRVTKKPAYAQCRSLKRSGAAFH
ncbi:hypothetical protein, partial [Escherichia coli]